MRSIAETDLGTPASPSTEQISLTIDGQPVTVPAGSSVLRAAASLGTQIPRSSAPPISLEPFGSCRSAWCRSMACKGTPASCTTPGGRRGMKVTTKSPKLARSCGAA
jgi:formate dehydrogenase major subunit